MAAGARKVYKITGQPKITATCRLASNFGCGEDYSETFARYLAPEESVYK